MYLYVKAITNVSMKEASFVVIFHQYLQWYPSDEEYQQFKSGQSDFYTPRILPSNCAEVMSEEEELRGSTRAIHELHDGGLDVWGTTMKFSEADGNVEKRPLLGISRKYQIKISSYVNLHDYPMDVQHLHMFFESMQTMAHTVLLPNFVYPEVMHLEFGAYASDADYVFHEPVVEFAAFGDAPNNYACCTVTFKLQRIVAGVMFRVFVPCAMLTLLCFCIFFIPYTDVGDRLGVIVTLILALVAFLYVVSENSPPIPYLTLGDKYITGSLLFLTLITLYICIAGLNTVVDSVYTDAAVGWVALGIWGTFQAASVIVAGITMLRTVSQLPLSYSEISDAGLLDEQNPSLEVASASVKMLYGKQE
jgi:hypothetical protein